jgi:hypothetical protein
VAGAAVQDVSPFAQQPPAPSDADDQQLQQQAGDDPQQQQQQQQPGDVAPPATPLGGLYAAFMQAAQGVPAGPDVPAAAGAAAYIAQQLAENNGLQLDADADDDLAAEHAIWANAAPVVQAVQPAQPPLLPPLQQQQQQQQVLLLQPVLNLNIVVAGGAFHQVNFLNNMNGGIQQLGNGGFGRVLLASYQGDLVAVKEIVPRETGLGQAEETVAERVERLRREVELLVSCHCLGFRAGKCAPNPVTP